MGPVTPWRGLGWLLTLLLTSMGLGGCATPTRGIVATTIFPGCVEHNIALGCRPLYEPEHGWKVYMACPDTKKVAREACQ